MTFNGSCPKILSNMIRNVQTFLVEKTFFFNLEDRILLDEKLSAKKFSNEVITLSRQHGCYGAETAIELQKLLDQGWVVFHREILEAIAKNSGVEEQYVEQFDEKTVPLIETIVSGFNKNITDTSYLNSLKKLFFSLEERGKVIIVGRGANFMLRRGFHIRLVAPKNTRVHNLMEINNYSRAEAEREIEEADMQRKKFIKRMFGAEVDDPLNYDLMINIRDIDFKETARLIYDAAQISSIFK